MHGTIIVNHALWGDKYKEQTLLYVAAAQKQGIDISICTNAQVCDKDNDFVLFLDKDVLLAKYLEQEGHRVFNSAKSIALCDDKALMYLALRNSGIKLPKTLIVPMTFFKSDWKDNPFVEQAICTLGFPMVVKEACGSFGWQVWLVYNLDDLVAKLNECSPKRVVLQEFIENSRGRDIRINVVGGKAVACMYRYSDTDFRANISAGGCMKKYTPNDKQIATAVDACNALGLDFGGVDLLFGDNDEPILCEVNSNAFFEGLELATGVRIAEKYAEHIVREMTK